MRAMNCWTRQAVVLLVSGLALAYLPGLVEAEGDDPRGAQQDSPVPNFTTKRVRGHVVWMAEALEKRYGVKTVADASEGLQAIETEDGALAPLVEDVRGRAFRRDPRLREMQVELLVREFMGTPMLQIARVYELTSEGKMFEIDYWCDVCSIAMFELKDCDCCQEDIRLRRRERPRKVAEDRQR